MQNQGREHKISEKGLEEEARGAGYPQLLHKSACGGSTSQMPPNKGNKKQKIFSEKQKGLRDDLSYSTPHMIIYAMHVYCMFLMEFPVLDLALDRSVSDISIKFMISACFLALWGGFKEQCTRTPY